MKWRRLRAPCQETPPPLPDGLVRRCSTPGSEREGARWIEAVEHVLSDCFVAVGQSIGMRTTVDYDAIVWWHDHFRTKFLAAMRRHGDRWLQDREGVTGVGWMLAQRAMRHAAGQDSIHVEAARRAAADVQRYCALRVERAARVRASHAGAAPRLAGLWRRPIPY